jgi:hypothetical protein
MASITLKELDVELRQMSDGNYVTVVTHKRFGALYEIVVYPGAENSIEIECIDRINNVTVDINTLEEEG